MDYYLHRSGGPAFDYFGGVGTPYKVCLVYFYIMKWLGFRATKVRSGSSIRRVMVRATLHQGAHRHSIKVREALNYGLN